VVVAKFQESLACLAIDRVGVVFSVVVVHNEEGVFKLKEAST
jgi:hypothetical protein